ncbi:MAG: hypothetical protein IPO32_15810 [Crocinitomicaceae bacterium]|nr:hypothetical protein [Crocinitomicaceae bacterium]
MDFSPKLVMLHMKVQKSSNLNPFGGLNFVMELDRQKIGALLNQELPAIGKQSQYSWRDLFQLLVSFYCGGDCEDLSR